QCRSASEQSSFHTEHETTAEPERVGNAIKHAQGQVSQRFDIADLHSHIRKLLCDVSRIGDSVGCLESFDQSFLDPALNAVCYGAYGTISRIPARLKQLTKWPADGIEQSLHTVRLSFVESNFTNDLLLVVGE